jgi:hypothetical protein
MGGFYTGHHTIYTDVYIHIYTLFSTLFRTKFQPLRSSSQLMKFHHQPQTQPSTSPPKKKFFHTNSQFFTRFHKISPSKNTKKHQNPQNREKPEKTVFLGVPPHPPKKPLFSRVFGPPNCTNLHKFAQICTNLHPQNTTFGGYPICRDPLDRPC